MAGTVALLGATGGVGRHALAHLLAWGDDTVRAGTRDPARLVADDPRVDVRAVDVTDPASLDAFCAGCHTVVNCAGPAATIGDTVARAAARGGAAYVDAAGDDPLHAAVSALPGAADRVAVLSAGLMPGLSGLLPAHLAATGAGGAADDRVRGWPRRVHAGRRPGLPRRRQRRVRRAPGRVARRHAAQPRPRRPNRRAGAVLRRPGAAAAVPQHRDRAGRPPARPRRRRLVVGVRGKPAAGRARRRRPTGPRRRDGGAARRRGGAAVPGGASWTPSVDPAIRCWSSR